MRRLFMGVAVLGTLALAATALMIGASMTAWSMLLAVALIQGRKKFKRALLLAVVILLAVLGARLARFYLPGPVRLISLPSGAPGLPLGALVDERDGTLLMGQVLLRAGRFNRKEAALFLPSLRETYEAMPPLFPTPAVATYLGLQSSERFDAVLIEPAKPSKVGVVFLHGFAGNFSVYCWQLSKAASAISAATLCPSLGPAGDWWRGHGLVTARRAIEHLTARGYRRIYLAGLSNGSVGAGAHAAKLKPAGLILISGTPTKKPVPGLETLVVHGTEDTMAPFASARRYARASNVSMAQFRSGHFVFLDRGAAVISRISKWLVQQEQRSGAAGR